MSVMEIHWGNLGSAAAGLAVLISVVVGTTWALVTRQGPKWLHEARERAAAQTEQARQEAALAAEQRNDSELDRERVLYGWAGVGSAGEVYTVALVTDPVELATAAEELSKLQTASQYVILRVNEHPDAFGNAGRALTLRRLIETSHLLSRAPEKGEYEVLRRAARELVEQRHGGEVSQEQ